MTAISTFRFHIQLVDDLFIKGFSGRVVHGAFLQFLREFNEDLTQYLHDYTGKKPYSTTEMSFRKMGDNRVAFFDVNTMDDEIINNLIKLVIADDNLEIFVIDRFCPIFKIEYQKTTIPDPEILPVGTKIWLNFDSTTIFSSTSRNANTDPYPHINVIWGQMIDLYSRLVDNIPEQDQALLIQKILNQMATPKFKVYSRHETLGHKIKVTGFKGYILFMIEDSSDLELISPILRLSDVWGIGGKTTMGFGRLNVKIDVPEVRKEKKSKELEKNIESSKE